MYVAVAIVAAAIGWLARRRQLPESERWQRDGFRPNRSEGQVMEQIAFGSSRREAPRRGASTEASQDASHRQHSRIHSINRCTLYRTILYRLFSPVLSKSSMSISISINISPNYLHTLSWRHLTGHAHIGHHRRSDLTHASNTSRTSGWGCLRLLSL